MSDYQDQIRSIAGEWAGEGYVVGVLPDRSDPGWSGRAVLGLIEAADRGGGPGVVLDLSPGDTDLASRFETGAGPGLAEMVDGEIELWEISHRSDVHRAVYVPEGGAGTGSELAGSETAARLAEKMRERGRLLVVVLDRRGAEAAASAGYLDGFVRVGDAEAVDQHESVPELGRITRRPGERGQVPETRSGPRLVLPPEMRSEHRRKRRIRRALIALAVVVALGLVASSLLGGPDLRDLFSDSDDASAAAARGEARQQEAAPADSPVGTPPLSSDTARGTAGFAGAAGEGTGDTAAVPGGGVDTSGPAVGAGAEGGGGEGSPLSGEQPAGSSDSTVPPLPESGGPPEFRAVADSLALGIREFTLQAERFRAGEIGCGTLIETRRRADRLFERLWLERMSLQPDPGSPAAATFRERARQMETVASTYDATSCPAEAFEGS